MYKTKVISHKMFMFFVIYKNTASCKIFPVLLTWEVLMRIRKVSCLSEL